MQILKFLNKRNVLEFFLIMLVNFYSRIWGLQFFGQTTPKMQIQSMAYCMELGINTMSYMFYWNNCSFVIFLTILDFHAFPAEFEFGVGYGAVMHYPTPLGDSCIDMYFCIQTDLFWGISNIFFAWGVLLNSYNNNICVSIKTHFFKRKFKKLNSFELNLLIQYQYVHRLGSQVVVRFVIYY